MSKTVIPQGYKSVLGLYETQVAIGLLRNNFQDNLCEALNLKRVTAPLFVSSDSGLNDDLNGVERAVAFDILETGGMAQVVHSLAKWKRMALCKYGFSAGEGLYTDMNAIRRDEEMDNTHSIYVDQWDWEKVITRDQRTEAYLHDTVRRIAKAISDTNCLLRQKYPLLTVELNADVTFLTAQELFDRYPGMTAHQREDAVAEEFGTVFISGIGAPLRNGMPHDGRAPDYDDWSLNGDLLYWDETLGRSLEISSMGIRVDAEALRRQLAAAGAEDRMRFEYHRAIAEDRLPLTIGGGIGQSRLCMLMLEKSHIGEVQVSVWPAEIVADCRARGIQLL